MSIFPATDIVSDVARAADPVKLRLATRRLEDIGAEKARSAEFALAAPGRSAMTPATIDTGAPRGVRVDTLGPTQKFEAFLLQNWLETVLPKTSSGVYGGEAGADIWRSMMAEQIGYQLARADVIGLHRLLDHPNSALSGNEA
jgi:hypothetical protein